MEQHECYQLVFSSSCTVYGEPTQLPITEEHPIGGNITNVYGKTKYFIEEMLQDVTYANKVRRQANYFTNFVVYLLYIVSKLLWSA